MLIDTNKKNWKDLIETVIDLPIPCQMKVGNFIVEFEFDYKDQQIGYNITFKYDDKEYSAFIGIGVHGYRVLLLRLYMDNLLKYSTEVITNDLNICNQSHESLIERMGLRKIYEIHMIVIYEMFKIFDHIITEYKREFKTFLHVTAKDSNVEDTLHFFLIKRINSLVRRSGFEY